jgi:hypothetical protein
MDKRRLVLGLSVLLLVAGALLACFTPGGLFNRPQVTQSMDVPFFGTMTVRAEGGTTAWPVVGYVLLGLGGVGSILAFAMKSPPKA